MIDHFAGKTAVLTGAGSGFGLECARIAAARGMNLVLVDVQQDALDKARAEMETAGAQVLARKVDVFVQRHECLSLRFKSSVLDPGAKPLEPFGERLECSEGESTGRRAK